MSNPFDQLPPDEAKAAKIADATVTIHLLRSRPANDREAVDALAALLGVTLNYMAAILGPRDVHRIVEAASAQMFNEECAGCASCTRH